MSSLQPVRGTHDLIGDAAAHYRFITACLERTCRYYGFNEIKTPIFEFTNVFSRTLGDASDIVSKEMYTFLDKGGDSISLRPEGTASVVRAFISEGLSQQLPLKFYYEGPMFRYERPQKGRYRQFYQIGIELLGTDTVQGDVETLSLADNLLLQLGVKNKVELEINSIGDKESRDLYRTALVDYYSNYKSSLSEDSLKRLISNPLRILDSKDKNDIEINKNAPKITEHLNEFSKTKFQNLQEELKNLNVTYTLNPQLVRGLDYYSHLVFEYKTSYLGAQDAVLSGGRYDGLSEIMGGPKTPAVGWAAGVERLSALLDLKPQIIRPLALIPLGDRAKTHGLFLCHELRKQGFAIEMAYGGNLSNRMQKATKKNAIAVLIFGDQELNEKSYTLKTLDSGNQEAVKFSQLPTRLTELFD